jgi:hypothetical protein
MREQRLADALQPFANSVFVDNGAVTFDHTMYGSSDLWRAYCTLKRRERAKAGR